MMPPVWLFLSWNKKEGEKEMYKKLNNKETPLYNHNKITYKGNIDNGKVYYNNSRKANRYTCKGISKFVYRLIWTALWLAFIFGLVALFGSMKPLWLLIVWLIGWAE